MTLPTRLVLGVLLEDADRPRYGLELCRTTGLPSGTVHPILARLELRGWVCSEWEEVDPREQGRPRRRYYRLVPDAVPVAQTAVARAHRSLERLRRSAADGA
ncbi:MULTISPECIES: PadR family transcriptional regulator [Actinosynnema]|uniref:PadR family transcriptional regulator n=1 Tax=Actinosynnema TaxID=40566 RepID=UPI0020A60B87|nr:helix-turn-helix transcriptional regulator [Actinosynnema pretiosum]MCP2098343.1 transcriptional regulator, PadR family [Actinosynnema pretiosum]